MNLEEIVGSKSELAAVWAFRVTDGLLRPASPSAIAAALRRAVMARFQRALGDHKRLPPYVSGHDAEGRPAEGLARLAFAYDPDRTRLLVIAPHAFRHAGAPLNEQRHLRVLTQTLEGFRMLRAGPAGRLTLEPEVLSIVEDPLFARSHRWVSRTPYVVNYHLNRDDARAALAADLDISLRQAGLPKARIRVNTAWAEPGSALTGLAALEFDVAVPGPIMCGRTRYKGGGLFGHQNLT